MIVEADSGLQVPDIKRANNTAVATAELSVQPPTLAVGTTLSGTIANGQDLYYQVAVAPSTSVLLTATFAQALESEFYVQFAALPTDSSFAQSSTDLSALSPQLQLPSGQGGDYYIWLHGREGAGDGQPFTLAASIVTFALDSFSEGTATNQGNITMNLTGAGFTSQTTADLDDGHGDVINAEPLTFVNGDELTATFDLTNEPAGAYTVQAKSGAQTASAPGSFEITAQPEVSDLEYSATSTPDGQVALGQFIADTATVTNVGSNDAQVPPLDVEFYGFSGASEETEPDGSNYVFAEPITEPVNEVYPGGTLAPARL